MHKCGDVRLALIQVRQQRREKALMEPLAVIKQHHAALLVGIALLLMCHSGITMWAQYILTAFLGDTYSAGCSG